MGFFVRTAVECQHSILIKRKINIPSILRFWYLPRLTFFSYNLLPLLHLYFQTISHSTRNYPIQIHSIDLLFWQKSFPWVNLTLRPTFVNFIAILALVILGILLITLFFLFLSKRPNIILFYPNINIDNILHLFHIIRKFFRTLTRPYFLFLFNLFPRLTFINNLPQPFFWWRRILQRYLFCLRLVRLKLTRLLNHYQSFLNHLNTNPISILLLFLWILLILRQSSSH